MQGSAAAQNGLGYMHMHGRGTKQNYKHALRYFKLAADHGNADAQFNLGVMYFGKRNRQARSTSSLPEPLFDVRVLTCVTQPVLGWRNRTRRRFNTLPWLASTATREPSSTWGRCT